MDTETIQERRLFERFSARFPAKFKDSENDFGKKVYLRDASAQGVKISTFEKLFLNENVTLEVQLPDSPDSMIINGKIIWAQKHQGNVWDFGLKCPKVNLMYMARLYKFVAPHPTE